MPIEPPINPSPLTLARRGSPVGVVLNGRSSIASDKIRTEHRRAVKEDVCRLVPPLVGLDVEEQAHAASEAAIDVELACPHDRYVSQPPTTSRRRRVGGVDVAGRSDEQADGVVGRDRVALEDGANQLLDALADLLGRVVVEGRRSPYGPYWHGGRWYRSDPPPRERPQPWTMWRRSRRAKSLATTRT